MKKLVALLLTGSMVLAASTSFAQDEPEAPEIERPEIPEELQVLIDEYKAEKQALRADLKAIIDELEDPTREDVQAVVEQFKEDNAETIEANKALATEIRETLDELYPDRPQRGDRPRADLGRELRGLVRETNVELRQLRQSTAEQLANEELTDEEREAIRTGYREQRREILSDMRQERRQLVKDAREDQMGERRGDG